MIITNVGLIWLLALVPELHGFITQSGMRPCRHAVSSSTILRQVADDEVSGGGGKDNKAMAFLRKIGKVGGAANQDFTNAVGVDEGTAGKLGSRLKVLFTNV